MQWIVFAAASMILLAAFDSLLKAMSDKIDSGLAALLISLISACVLVAYVVFQKYGRNADIEVTREGFIYAVIAAVVIGIANITFLKMFENGSSLSIGVAVVRTGMIMLAVLVGIFVFAEKVTLQQVLGFGLSLAGIALLLL